MIQEQIDLDLFLNDPDFSRRYLWVVVEYLLANPLFFDECIRPVMLLAGHLTLWIWNVKVWNLTKTFLFENQDLWFQTLPQSPDEKWIQFNDGHDQRYSMANTLFQEILRFSKNLLLFFQVVYKVRQKG